jgi:hypothetical protein
VREPFPSLRQTYPLVQQEKSRRNAMLHLVIHERLTMIGDSNQKNFRGFTHLSEPRLQTKNNWSVIIMDEPNILETYFKRMRWEKIGFPRSQALVLEIAKSPVFYIQSNTSTLSKEKDQILRPFLVLLPNLFFFLI